MVSDEPNSIQPERVFAESALQLTPMLASIEPPVIEDSPAPAPVAKKKRAVRRKQDDVPMPPWLSKRGRR